MAEAHEQTRSTPASPAARCSQGTFSREPLSLCECRRPCGCHRPMRGRIHHPVLRLMHCERRTDQACSAHDDGLQNAKALSVSRSGYCMHVEYSLRSSSAHLSFPGRPPRTRNGRNGVEAMVPNDALGAAQHCLRLHCNSRPLFARGLTAHRGSAPGATADSLFSLSWRPAGHTARPTGPRRRADGGGGLRLGVGSISLSRVGSTSSTRSSRGSRSTATAPSTTP